MSETAVNSPAFEYASRIALSTTRTLKLSMELAFQMRHSDGDYVECGVAAGAQVIVMAQAAPGKTIWCFDSFQGIPLASNRDWDRPGIATMTKSEKDKQPPPGDRSLLKSSGISSISKHGFLSNLIAAGVWHSGIKIVQGWFEDTMSKNEIDRIALLRLDGDLYNSTLVCLQHLFPKVIKGGAVIIDDYSLGGCREACSDYFGEIKYRPQYKRVSDVAYFYK